MVLWRISNHADLRGTGGLRAAARWHYAGQPVVYLAEHPALALLEIIVHLELADADALPDTYQLLKLEADDDVTMSVLDDTALPQHWRTNMAWTQETGTEWLQQGESTLLKVPSVIVPYASNFLLNPLKRDAVQVEIAEVMSVHHDPRIMKLLRSG